MSPLNSDSRRQTSDLTTWHWGPFCELPGDVLHADIFEEPHPHLLLLCTGPPAIARASQTPLPPVSVPGAQVTLSQMPDSPRVSHLTAITWALEGSCILQNNVTYGPKESHVCFLKNTLKSFSKQLCREGGDWNERIF